jgi:S1-C subfamily serine protease
MSTTESKYGPVASSTSSGPRAARLSPGLKNALLLLLALLFGIQVTILLVYYLASPYLPSPSSTSSTATRRGPVYRPPQTGGVMLTACDPEALATAVAKVRPAVVYITGHPVDNASSSMRPVAVTLGTLTSDRMGSGIIFDPRGHILTNYHVIGNLSDIRVTLFGDRERAYAAEVITADADADLAVIKIAPPYTLPVAKLGNSDMLELGDELLAIGCPFNLEQSVSHGIVSDVKRTVTIDGRAYADLIQTDASINAGNSGGALINTNGEVVGVNVAIYAPNRVYCGVGFAIPINRAKLLLMKIRYSLKESTASS